MTPRTIRPVAAAALLDIDPRTLSGLVTAGVFSVIGRRGRGLRHRLYRDEVELYDVTRDADAVRELRLRARRIKPRERVA